MDEKIERLEVSLEDGRKAEKVITEKIDTSGESEIVTEYWVEPVIEKHLASRVKEHKKHVIVGREIDTIDEETGEIIERKVESVDTKMQVVEHIGVAGSVVEEQGIDDCTATKQDIVDALVTVAKIFKEGSDDNVASCSSSSEGRQVSAMQAMVGDRVLGENSGEKKEIPGSMLFWVAVIAAQMAALGYLLFM